MDSGLVHGYFIDKADIILSHLCTGLVERPKLTTQSYEKTRWLGRRYHMGAQKSVLTKARREVSSMRGIILKKGFIFFSVSLLLSLALLASTATEISAYEKTETCLKPIIRSISPNTAKPGDKVRIRGRRFTRVQGEVAFSPEVEADIVRWTNRRIWVIVPESATSGPVTVTVQCGSVSNEKHFPVKP